MEVNENKNTAVIFQKEKRSTVQGKISSPFSSCAILGIMP